MSGGASAIFSLPLSQKNWRDAVRSFLCTEKRTVFAVKVSIERRDGSIVANESWTNDERNNADLADGIAEWIELRSESRDDLDTTITVSGKLTK
jgi:hypothetical protein